MRGSPGDPEYKPPAGLWFALQGEALQRPVPGGAVLAALLVRLARDAALRADLERAAGGPLGPLLPGEPPAEESSWWRELEMLEEGYVCPGERLLASSLHTAARWWPATEIHRAARALATALAAGDVVPGAGSAALALATMAAAAAGRSGRLLLGPTEPAGRASP